MANISFSKSDSSLRGSNSISSLSKISLANSNSNKQNKNNEFIDFGTVSPIVRRENGSNNMGRNNFEINLYSPLSINNPNNIGFIDISDEFKKKYSFDGVYGEHQIDIVYMDDANYIRSIKFKIDFHQSVSSINYIKDTNSIFIITSFGEIYEIKL